MDKWAIRLPFTVPNGRRIEILTEKQPFQIGGIDYWLEAQNTNNHDNDYALNAEGFANEQKALDFVEIIRSSLLHASAVLLTGLVFDERIGRNIYPKKPRDGWESSNINQYTEVYVDGSCTTVYPMQHHKRVLKPFQATVTQGISFNIFFDAVTSGIQNEIINTNIKSDRIKLAFELFSHSNFLASPHAKFVSLMTVLEVLAKQQNIPDRLLDNLKRWNRELSELERDATNQTDRDELQSMKSRLGILKQESIKQSIKRLVGNCLGPNDQAERQRHAKKTSELYDIRSSIVHDGHRHDLGQSLTELTVIVRKTLLSVASTPQEIE